MFTPALVEINKQDPANPFAVVLYTDNLKYKFLEKFPLKNLTATSFRNQVEAKRLEYESYSFIDTLDTSFDLTPDDNTPTQDQLNRRKYFKDKSLLINMMELVTLGIKKSTDQDILDQQDLINSELKPEYLDFP